MDARRALCERLGIDKTSFVTKGFLIVSPPREQPLAALSEMESGSEPRKDLRSWTFVSNRRATVDTPVEVGAFGELDEGQPDGRYQYISVQA